MSKEIFEISVSVDEEFDLSFDLAEGIYGFILRFLDN
ncbi:MAG: phenylalanyl-tRNA synthetase subunit alpha [Bacteroidota bacterium]